MRAFNFDPKANMEALHVPSNCVAIGIKATGCCDGAIAIGDYVVSTLKQPHVIGKVLFGKPIPHEVQQLFCNNPKAFVWLIRECLYYHQDPYEVKSDCR